MSHRVPTTETCGPLGCGISFSHGHLTTNTGHHWTNKMNLICEHRNVLPRREIIEIQQVQEWGSESYPEQRSRCTSTVQAQAAAVARIHGRVIGRFTHLSMDPPEGIFVGSIGFFLKFSKHLSNIWWKKLKHTKAVAIEVAESTECGSFSFRKVIWSLASSCQDARSTFRGQRVKSTTCSDHFWTFRCRFAWQAQKIVHLVTSEHNVRVLRHFQKRWQARDVWRGSAKMHVPWQAQYKRHVPYNVQNPYADLVYWIVQISYFQVTLFLPSHFTCFPFLTSRN